MAIIFAVKTLTLTYNVSCIGHVIPLSCKHWPLVWSMLAAELPKIVYRVRHIKRTVRLIIANKRLDILLSLSYSAHSALRQLNWKIIRNICRHCSHNNLCCFSRIMARFYWCSDCFGQEKVPAKIEPRSTPGCQQFYRKWDVHLLWHVRMCYSIKLKYNNKAK